MEFVRFVLPVEFYNILQPTISLYIIKILITWIETLDLVTILPSNNSLPSWTIVLFNMFTTLFTALLYLFTDV